MEELLRRKQQSKTKSFKSPSLEDKIEIILSDNRTKVYFNKDVSLEKMATKIAKYEQHINKLSVDIENYYIKGARKNVIV